MHYTKAAAITIFLFLLLGACGDTHPRQASSPGNTAPTAKPLDETPSTLWFSQQKERCEATPQARFNEHLVSCSCPRGSAFHPLRGCQALTVHPAAQACRETGFSTLWTPHSGTSLELQKCLESLYGEMEVRIDAQAFTAEELQKILFRLDHDFFSFAHLFHLSPLAISEQKSRIFVDVTSLAAKRGHAFTDLVMRNFHSIPVFGPVEELPLPAFTHEVFSQAAPDTGKISQWIKQCSEKIGSTQAQSAEICRSLRDALLMLNNRNAESAGEFQNFDKNCNQCSYISSLPSPAPFLLSKKIFLKNQVPIIRYLRLNAQDFQATIYLAGDGSIIATLLATLVRDKQKELVYSQLRGFDALWQPIYSRDENKGDPKAIYQYLVERKHQQDTRAQSDSRIGILLLESGINPLMPSFGHQLALQPDALAALREPYNFETFLDDLRHPLGLDVPQEVSPLQRLLFLFDNNTFETGTAHGTRVASVVLAHLPAAKLYVVPPRQLPADPRVFAEYIRQRSIRVVNISQIFDRGDFRATSCSAYFADLYALLPGTIFIAGAGNTRTPDPDVCPGSINVRGKFGNAITVAGSQGERLDPGSSYGKFSAHGAAPFSVPCSGGTSRSPLDVLSNEQSCAGTSFSTAVVSNAVARFALMHPDYSGHELASALLATCSDSGLPLSCGGIFQLSHLH